GAAMSDHVGWVFAHGPGVGPAVWGFTAAVGGIAWGVAGRLGGVPTVDEGGAWGLITESSALRVEVAGCAAETLAFRLVGARELGVFGLRFGAWSLAEVLGASVVAAVMAASRPMCELVVSARDVTTLGGRIVRYPVPRLSLCV
ncbi:hypothetical protein ACWC5I_46325, partial [Kitasatospora sp. NPDC001574]